MQENYHTHHKLPKHAGGTDDPSNLIKVTVTEHAELHLARYLEFGDGEDWIAYHGLSGQITQAEAISQARRNWIANNPGHHAKAGRKGGKAPASEKTKQAAAKSAAKLSKVPHWNNGTDVVRSKTCPGPGWVKGRGHWWTNGSETKQSPCSPGEGWRRGRVYSDSAYNGLNNQRSNRPNNK